MLEYTNLPTNITEYPNSFERQGAFPLERYSVFYNYDDAEEYAYSDPVAYIGQPIAVVGENVVYYLIGPDKGLIRFGTRLEIDKLDARISEIEKFFALEEGESLKETLDQLIELQKWIEEHLGDFDSFKNETNENLALEKEAREKKDQELSEAIVNERVRAIEVEETLGTAIAKNAGQIESEQSAREEADAGLARDISTEKSARQSQVSELQTALNEEIGRAMGEERALSQNLIDTTVQIYNTLNVRFLQEATERTEAIKSLETDTEKRLNSEAAAREESDELLLTKISEESTERKDEAEALRSTLLGEIETARAQENELSRKIAAEERTRANEDVSIMISLNNEKQERQQEDSRILGIIGDIGNSTVASRLDDLNQRMLDTDDKLREDIAAETERANAALAKETARAIAEEQMLAESLNKETSKLDILIGPDGEKSARTIANEELAAQLLSGKADADFKTLQQLAAWLEGHPEDVAAINKAIKDETDRALAAEAVIEKALKQESDRATEKEEALELAIARNTGLISSEEESRKEADTALSTSLSVEVAARQSQVAELQSAINEEIGRATNKEAELAKNLNDAIGQISGTLETRLKTETDERIAAFEALESSVDARIEAEIVSREENDELLQAKIEDEIAERKDEAEAIKATLLEEIETARSAESELSQKIDAEVRARANEDLSIMVSLNAEIARSAEKDNEHTDLLTTLISTDGGKSIRRIANEELAAQLLSGKADADFKTLQELATWLEDHPESVADINQAISNNTDYIDQHTHVVEYTPSGEVSKPTFTGTEATITVSGTPSGSIDQAIFTGTEATITVSGTPLGEVSQPTFTGAEATITVSGTPAGEVSQPTFTGKELTSEGTYTPKGDINVELSVVQTNQTVNEITSSGALPTLTTSYDENTKTLKFIFGQGSLPTYQSKDVGVTVAVSTATFTGTEGNIQVKGTPEGEISQPTFTGEQLDSTGTYTPEGVVSKPDFSGQNTAFIGQYKPEGSINEQAFSGDMLTSTGTYTPAGDISKPTFSGTADAVITKPAKEVTTNE